MQASLFMAQDGIEPPTQGFSVLCSTDWATEPLIWRSGRDSNPRPPAWQAGILTNWTTRPIFNWLSARKPSLPASYWQSKAMTPTGLEPVLPPWKGGVLTAWPRGHKLKVILLKQKTLVSHEGLEPSTLWLKVRCSTNWANGSYI